MEAAIALGVVPVAGADWFGLTSELRTWVKPALGDRTAPTLINANELNYEEIAAQRPDVILYVNSTNDKAQCGGAGRSAAPIRTTWIRVWRRP